MGETPGSAAPAKKDDFPGSLVAGEIIWRDRYDYFEQRGYQLRPRFKPGWEPSWRGKRKDYEECEDGQGPIVCTRLRAVVHL
jgi:hypothetical protein